MKLSIKKIALFITILSISLFFAGPTKAEVNYSQLFAYNNGFGSYGVGDFSNYYQEINDFSGTSLICIVSNLNYRFGIENTEVKLRIGNDYQNSKSFLVSNQINNYSKVFYFNNVRAENFFIDFYPTAEVQNSACFSITNSIIETDTLMSSNPIILGMQGLDSSVSPLVFTNNWDNIFLLGNLYYINVRPSFTGGDNLVWTDSNPEIGNGSVDSAFLTGNDIGEIAYSGGTLSYYFAVPVKELAPKNYIIAYPEEPDYTPIGGNFNISYVFDVCEYQNLNPTSTLSIGLEPMGEGRNKEIITNCSGAKKFTTENLETVEGSYPNAYFRIYDETLYKEIAISNEFWEVIYKQIEGSELFLRPLKFNATYEGATSPEDTSTITIPFMYSFCNNVIFSETNKICIVSRNNNNTKPSNICFTTETCGGIGSVKIPKFSGGTTNNWRFDYFDNSGKRLFEGREFSITFEAVNEPLSDSNVYGMDAHDIACSAEEWATPNPVWEILGNSVEMPALNFIYLKCKTFEGAIKTGNFLVNGFIGIIKNLAYGQMANAFPLNVPFLTLEAWNKATIEQAPSEIEEIISTNENNNIVLPIPEEWTNGEELEIIVWGGEIFEKDNKIKKIFDLTRIITAWGFYIGLIGYLIKLGVMLWEEFIRKKKSGLDLQSVSVYDKENNATFNFKAWDEED